MVLSPERKPVTPMENESRVGPGPVSPRERLAYDAPVLTDHGSVHQLILGQGGSAFDGMSGMGMQ